MSGQVMAVVFFCLATGAALGCLFLLFRGMSLVLGLGKLATGILDAVFCCLCGGVVFLCALAVDNGHLRLYQAALQGIGGWCTVTALGPGLQRASRALKKFFGKVWAFLAGRRGILWGLFPTRGAPSEQRGKKAGKKPKKQRKKT